MIGWAASGTVLRLECESDEKERYKKGDPGDPGGCETSLITTRNGPFQGKASHLVLGGQPPLYSKNSAIMRATKYHEFGGSPRWSRDDLIQS